MRRTSLVILALAAGALVCASAQAETRKRHPPATEVERDAAAAELTVKKRSWLDPGNVVSIGTQNRYMDDSTIWNHTPSGTWRRSEFGDEVLPGPFDLPNYSRYAPW